MGEKRGLRFSTPPVDTCGDVVNVTQKLLSKIEMDFKPNCAKARKKV
jgi:hypothetical protein